MTDARKLLATRAIRGLADGMVSVRVGKLSDQPRVRYWRSAS
jgi:hypothetical protein